MCIDKKSKSVLKYIIAEFDGDYNHEIVIHPDSFDLNLSELYALCLNLYHLGLLQDVICIDESQTIEVSISYAGLRYFKNFKNWWYDNWIAVLTLIITFVSLISSMIQ